MSAKETSPAVSEEMRTLVRARLRAIESEENVRVLLAVESGSRAWGFPSPDSDYDVRFIYIRRPKTYLTVGIRPTRDVIERPISGDLDLSGWDLRKALRLFANSNPPLLEWLQMNWVYAEAFSVAPKLRLLMPASYSSRTCFHHYFSMGSKHIADHLGGETASLKKYFYVLRPIFAMRWLERGLGPAPIEFSRLLDATLEDPVLASEIAWLTSLKRNVGELGRGPRRPVLDTFIASEMGRFERVGTGLPGATIDHDALDALFRSTLREVWGTEMPT